MKTTVYSRVLMLTFVFVCMLFLLAAPPALRGQGVAINSSNADPDASAMLDVSSTSKGMLIPRMTSSKRTSISSPATGLLVYQTNSPAGFYFYDGSSWTHLTQNASMGSSGRVAFWNSSTSLSGSGYLFWDNTNKRLGLGTTTPSQQLELTGNLSLPATTATAGIVYCAGVTLLHTRGTGNTFVGRRAGNLGLSGKYNSGFGKSALEKLGSGDNNTATGYYALYSNSNGSSNTANGYQALYLNSGGSSNTASGYKAMYSNKTGTSNTASGYQALYSNDIGTSNTASGYQALYSNDNGSSNTASGYQALYSNDFGSSNTANGYQALYKNTGSYNTATGSDALYTNAGGQYNTASGYQALYTNVTGNNNMASGYQALYKNTGSYNTATGSGALYTNAGGQYNTAIGYLAMYSNTGGNYNTAVGKETLKNSTGNNNTAIGNMAGSNITSGNNNICIDNLGVAGESKTIRIGDNQTACYIKGIYGKSASSGTGVYINSSGKLGTTTSSRRFKHDIRDMGSDSDVLMKLRPVTFRYKPDYDPDQSLQYGLVAEEVEKVAPGLVAYDKEGRPYSVYYHKVNAMLLNEVQKQYRINQKQQKKIEELERQVRELEDLQTLVSALQAKVREMDLWSAK